MIKLKSICAFRELPAGYHKSRQHLPSIRDLLSPVAEPYERLMLKYLFDGVIFDPLTAESPYDIFTPGLRIGRIVVDEYQPGDPFLTAGGSQTDGVWYWHGFHIYYFKQYHLALDPAFVERAAVNNWKIKADSIDVKQIDYDAYLCDMSGVIKA